MNGLSVIFVLTGVALSSVSAHIIPQNCSDRYHSALTEALEAYDECKNVLATDCCQILNLGNIVNSALDIPPLASGVRFIQQVCTNENRFQTHSEMQARCDMETDEGGWLVIQRRVSGGTENFDRNWADYKNGFGNLNGEFWYGLENIHCLTEREYVELRVDLSMNNGTKHYRNYQVFQVAAESTNYRMTIGQGEGNFSYDFMAYSNSKAFTTRDRDNDGRYRENCATLPAYGNGSGWWYLSCDHATLNRPPKPRVYNGRTWVEYDSVEMKIRPKSCFR